MAPYGGRSGRNPVQMMAAWVKRQPPKVKAFLAVIVGMAALAIIRFVVHDHDNLFVAAEASHSIGICVLIYKLIKERTCAGSSFLSFFLLHLRRFHWLWFTSSSHHYPLIQFNWNEGNDRNFIVEMKKKKHTSIHVWSLVFWGLSKNPCPKRLLIFSKELLCVADLVLNIFLFQ